MRKTAIGLADIASIILITITACSTTPERPTWSVEIGDDVGVAGPLAEKELVRAIRVAGGEMRDSGQATHRVALALGEDQLAAEGYEIMSDRKGSGPQIYCRARDQRGLLYAAYDLAQRIRHDEPLDDLRISEEPYSTYRQIVACSCNHDFYKRLIQTMPRWRMNGLLLYSAYHQSDEVGITNNRDSRWFGTYLTLPITYRKYPRISRMIEQSPDYQHVRDSFPRLLSLARDHGVDVSLKFQILSYVRVDSSGGHYMSQREHLREDFPHLFPSGIKQPKSDLRLRDDVSRSRDEQPDWNSQAVYDFIREQLEELFTLYPDLGGITATSDEMSAFNIGHAASRATPEQRRIWARRMVDTVEDVCARFSKRCYWDLHGADRVYLETLVEIAKARPGGLRLRAESVPYEQVFSDKFPSYPFEKLAEAGDGMCDHDIHMEGFQDFPWLPNIIDRYVVRHTRAGIQAGLRGGGAMWYIYRPHFSPLNSLGQINMELVSRLLWNPDESLDHIWDRWLKRRFGSRAATAAGHLLRSTHEALNGILYFDNRNATFWLQYGFPKNLTWLMRPTWGQLIEYFQPPGTPLYAHPFSVVSRERTLSIGQMRQEKQNAVQQTEGLLNYLIEHQNEFGESDYRSLLPRYVALLYYARSAEQLVEALYNFTNLHIRAYDPDCENPRRDMEQAMNRLEKIHEEMLDDERLLLLEPSVYYRGLKPNFLDNISTLLADLRFHDRVLSAPQLDLENLSAEEQAEARRIRDYAEKIRRKFERNVRGEINEDELWDRWGYPGLKSN